MIVILLFLLLSILFVISLAFFVADFNRKKYMSQIEEKMTKKGFKILKIESTPQPKILEEEELGLLISPYGSSLVFKLYKKITFSYPNGQVSDGFVEIKFLFLIILSIKVFDPEKKLIIS